VAVLIGGIVAIVVIVGVTIGVLLRGRSRDDVHSVEHYHRQLHTLEEMRAHPSRPGGNGRTAYPSPAFRVGTSTVRLTDPDHPLVPPVPPPPVPQSSEPVEFADESDGLADGGEPEEPGQVSEPAAVAVATSTTSAKGEERALHAINRRPRRLGAPLAAIGAVIVLVVVLIFTGLHTTSPPQHHGTATTVTTTTTTTHSRKTHEATSTTTAAPVVSAPSAATNHDATYQVADASYSLQLSATNGECWVEAADNSGAVLFTGVLFSGQSHTVSATGSVTVIAGAPNAFSATVNGSPVSLPSGFVAPFTLKFVSPGGGGVAGAGAGAAGTTGGTGTGGTGTGAGAAPQSG
jgi:RodZ C-terminal domain